MDKLDLAISMLEKMAEEVSTLSLRIDKFVTDLSEFSERFEEVVSQLEDERRLDIMRDYD